MPSHTFEEGHTLWKKFLARWTPQALADMTLPQYHTAGNLNKDNLVNWLENRTECLGSIRGGDAFKFGVYNRQKNSKEINKSGITLSAEYGWRNKYGASLDEAFLKVRGLILDIVAAAQQADIVTIDGIDFSPTVKWKLAFLFQPQDSPFIPCIYKAGMLQCILRIDKPLSMSAMYQQIMKNNNDQDILVFTGKMLERINLEKPYQEWLQKQTHSSGKLYKPRTIYHYVRALKAVTTKIEGIEIQHTNLFHYVTPNTFAEIHKRIVTAPNYEKVNAEWANGAYAASMERYKAFLKEYTEKSDEPAIDKGTPPFIEPKRLYTLQAIRDEGCFISSDTLARMFARLLEKKNIILQGPPGTGKTWLAKRLAWALVDEKNSLRVQALQFHATLSYEDFVCGWRPVGDGKLELLDGPFLEALARANENPETPYVLVIEEINRGNPAQILGELLTLLEADKRKPEEALRLCYQKKGECRTVHLPANLYIIGTMNIADRSLAIVDFALRRRFAFFNLTPNFGEDWQNWMRNQAGLPTAFVAALGESMQACNAVIANDKSLGPQYTIGHSFVTCNTLIADSKAWIEAIIDAEITPLLKEYWFDDPKKAEDTAQNILAALP